MVDRRLLRHLDYTLLITVLLLVVFGLAMVYSATHATERGSLLTLKKQLVGVVLGLGGMVFLVFLDYHVSQRFYYLIYFGNLFLLAAVLFFGKEVHGAKSWFRFGSFSFQPSELAKVAVIVTLARYLDKKESLAGFWDLVGPFLHVGLPLVLILLQPDLGTALVFIFITFSMLYMAGAKGKHLALIGGVPFFLLVLWLFLHLRYGFPIPLKEYQVKRLTSFIDPARDPQGAGYNLLQAMIAIGSGRFLGKGYLRGTQGRLGYVPEHQTDFIFTIVGEELGFLGGFILLALFFTLIWRGLRIAYQAKDRYGQLLAVGVVAMFLFHVMENIGMNLGIMPITGIPLPFISAGASSMTASLWAVGILENVWARRQKIMF